MICGSCLLTSNKNGMKYYNSCQNGMGEPTAAHHYASLCGNADPVFLASEMKKIYDTFTARQIRTSGQHKYLLL